MTTMDRLAHPPKTPSPWLPPHPLASSGPSAVPEAAQLPQSWALPALPLLRAVVQIRASNMPIRTAGDTVGPGVRYAE